MRYRIVTNGKSTFRPQKKGFLWGWNNIYAPGHSGSWYLVEFSTQRAAEAYIKTLAPDVWSEVREEELERMGE